MEQEYFSVIQSVSRKHENSHLIEQVLKVDIEAILEKIQDVETKLTESRTDKPPTWALLLQSRLDNIEKNISLQQIKSAMSQSRLSSAKLAVDFTNDDGDDDDDDEDVLPPSMASGAASGRTKQNMPGSLTHQKSISRLQDISSDDRLYEKLRLEIESHLSSAQMGIESKMGTLSLEIDRLNKLLQSRPSTSDIQKIIKNISDINQKVEQSVHAATEQVRIEMQESSSEEMKGVIDYVRKQEDLHQENMRVLMNKIDHSNRDSTNTRQLVESSFEYIQKHMAEVVEENEELKMKLQNLEDGITVLQTNHNETIENFSKYDQYQQDHLVLDDEMKKKLIAIENSIEVLSTADTGIDALIERLDEKLKGESEEMNVLHQQLSIIQIHNEEIDKNFTQLQSDIQINVKDAIKETNKTMTERLNILNNQLIQTLQNDKMELQKSIIALEISIEKHTLDMNTIDSKQTIEIDHLKTHVQLTQDDMMKKTELQMNELMETLKKQMDAMMSLTKNNKTAISDIYSKLDDIHESLNGYQTLMQTLESNQLIKHNEILDEIHLINNRVNPIHHKITQVENNTNTLIDAMQGHDERILNLKVSIERCEDDLSTTYSEIRLHLMNLIEAKTMEMEEKFNEIMILFQSKETEQDRIEMQRRNSLLTHLIKEKGDDTKSDIAIRAFENVTGTSVSIAANISSKHPFSSNNTNFKSQKSSSSLSLDHSPRHHHHHHNTLPKNSRKLFPSDSSIDQLLPRDDDDDGNISITTSNNQNSISLIDNNSYHSGMGIYNNSNNSRSCTGQDLKKIFDLQSRRMADLCLNFEDVAMEKSFVPTFSSTDCEHMAVTAQEISEMIAIYADNEAIKSVLRQKPGSIDNNHNNLEDISIPERRGKKIEEFMKETAFLVTQKNGQPGLIRLDARERFFKQLQKVLDIAISKHDQILVIGTSSLGRLKIPTCIACDRPLADKARRSDAVIYADNTTTVSRYPLFNNSNNNQIPESGRMNSPTHNSHNNTNGGGAFPSLHHSNSSPTTAVMINNNNNNNNTAGSINKNLSPILNRSKSAQSGGSSSSNSNTHIPGQLKAISVRASNEQ